MTARRGDGPGGEGGRVRRAVLEGDDGRPPVVVLREDVPPRVRRRRWIAAILAAAALLGGLYLGRDAVARWTGVELPGVGGDAGAAEASGGGSDGAGGSAPRDPGPGRPSAGTAAADTSAAALLERRLDSLAASLDRYRERHGDFVRGRLGCEGLSRGFTEVQERFGAASRAFGRRETRAAAGDGGVELPGQRYRRLSVTADSVGRLFAASGCPESGP